MPRLPLLLIALVSACSPPPQDTAMHSPDPQMSAAVPMPSPSAASAAASPPHGATAPDSGQAPAAAPAAFGDDGRRILSTAFVRIGPDGHLSVDLRDGRTLVLRDVTMGPRDYCGTQVSADRAAAKFCGAYADVAAARPGGGPMPGDPPSSDPLPTR